MLPDFDTITARRVDAGCPTHIGRSRAGRELDGYRFGDGDTKVSLIAGCHADEPTGPRLLGHVVGFLAGLDPAHELLTHYQWWIVPHINPDGAVRNAAWSEGADDVFDIVDYLRHVVRELPGDDIEFGFPRGEDDAGARPENRAVYDWWAGDPAPFSLHASLHGMAFAAGPWFLVDAAWMDRCGPLMEACRDATERLGYVLHDVERNGEKGFHRIARGFCTRPDSVSMARYFLDRGDGETAAKFRPSSMETIRSFGGDALTLVSEIPLFVTPGVGETIAPDDPAAAEWRGRIEGWKREVEAGARDAVAARAATSGLRPVPIGDQMRLQWEMIRAAVDLVTG